MLWVRLTLPSVPKLNSTKHTDSRPTGKGSADYIQADLYKVEDCKKIAEELGKRETKLHVLINNSGSNWGAPYDEFPESAWTRVLTLNLTRVFTLTQALTHLTPHSLTLTHSHPHSPSPSLTITHPLHHLTKPSP